MEELIVRLLKVFIDWWLENRDKDKDKAISEAASKFNLSESKVREYLNQSESIHVTDSDREIITTNPDGSYASWYQTFYHKEKEKSQCQGYVSWYETYYKNNR